MIKIHFGYTIFHLDVTDTQNPDITFSIPLTDQVWWYRKLEDYQVQVVNK
jgi:hypothetical protein